MPKTNLTASRTPAFRLDPAKLIIITDPKHPLFDVSERHQIDEAMVRNIMCLGVKEPVLVSKDGDRLRVVDGRRRVLHAVEANKRLTKQGEPPLEIPVMLEKGDDEHLASVMVSLNEMRRDDTPLTKARKAASQISRGVPRAQVLVSFGVTSRTLSDWLLLVTLSAPVQKAVEVGLLSASAAAPLAAFPKAEQKERLEAIMAAGGEGKKTTARDTKRAVRKERGEEFVERPSFKQLQTALETVKNKRVHESSATSYQLAVLDVLLWVCEGVRSRVLESALMPRQGVTHA